MDCEKEAKNGRDNMLQVQNSAQATNKAVKKWKSNTKSEQTRRDSFLVKLGYTDDHEKKKNSSGSGEKHSCSHVIGTCLRTWVMEPGSRLQYYWLLMTSSAIMYNFVILVARFVFDELNEGAMGTVWKTCDYICDAVYIADIIVQARTGYLQKGLVVRKLKRTFRNYRRKVDFKFDIICVLPTDVFYAFNINHPTWNITWIRFNRLLKFRRLGDCFDRTEARTTYPNVIRITNLLLYIIVIIHWNACLYYVLSNRFIGLGKTTWAYPGLHNMTANPEFKGLTRKYLYCLWWSTLTLTTISEVPPPTTDFEYIFVTIDFLIGVLIFATLVGNIGNMVTNITARRTEFQRKVDDIKRYLGNNNVKGDVQQKVIKWLDYLSVHRMTADEAEVLESLPEKLRAEIAIHVHMETMKRMAIFKDCEPGVLVELVLRLKRQIFSPGIYICRKGDIGREMFIVKTGKLQVVADDETTVYATLTDGSVFGEVSILNIAGNTVGNRRTANVRSIGYSDCFSLSKDDLWDVLSQYPEAKVKLLQRGKEILKMNNQLDESIVEQERERETDIDKMDEAVQTFQTRLARLMGEYNSMKVKLMQRIEHLEEEMDAKDEKLFSKSHL